MNERDSIDDKIEELSQLMSEAEQEALAQESVRQEIDEFQGSLEERDKGLKAMEEAQQLLEDELEDSNKEIDRLQRELDKAMVEAEEAKYLRREADGARKQLEGALYKVQEGVEDARVTDLRDERMHRSSRPLDIGQVTRRPFWYGLMLGVLLGTTVGVLAAFGLNFTSG